ncbi:hypothetical protein Y032_1383g3856 [Ancylostoma ceylanicum]|uniref:GED domain-containing protein n=1 Tax=Ancylostoma ceylanicum TaxID=53326 RepID=A0A016W696_9BILA|nr:hypothetical protein Y032_1383g3856 [Ancylostoma ceylanicum]
MTTSDSMDDLDLEYLLLEDPTAAEQIATMRASIDRLTETVQKLAESSAAQVNSVCEVMNSKIKTVQIIPDSFLKNSAKKRKEAEKYPFRFSVLNAKSCAVWFISCDLCTLQWCLKVRALLSVGHGYQSFCFFQNFARVHLMIMFDTHQ